MKSRWQAARKRSRKALLMMKKAMSQLLCQREAIIVQDAIKPLPVLEDVDHTVHVSHQLQSTRTVSPQGTPGGRFNAEGNDEHLLKRQLKGNSTQENDAHVHAPPEQLIKDGYMTENKDERPQCDGTSDGFKQCGESGTKEECGGIVGGLDKLHVMTHDDVGNKQCVKEDDTSKECANDAVGVDLKNNCDTYDNKQHAEAGVDSKMSDNSGCTAKDPCKECDSNGCIKGCANGKAIVHTEDDCHTNIEVNEHSSSLGKEENTTSFRKLHSDVVERLTSLCQQWEQRQTVIIVPEERQEDVHGQIRTTVCQAQLLMKQKLKQYIQVVGQAEHGGGEQPTKVEDLQGFWDMVYFQVEDILKKFQGLESLEKNNWQAESESKVSSKKGKQKQATAITKKVTSAVAGLSEKQLAAREKREAARLKILELKALAVSKKEQDDRAADTKAECSSGDGKVDAPHVDAQVETKSEPISCEAKVEPTDIKGCSDSSSVHGNVASQDHNASILLNDTEASEPDQVFVSTAS